MADEGRFRSDAGRSCMSGAHEGGGGPGGFLRSGALHRLVCSRSLSVWPVTGSWLRPPITSGRRSMAISCRPAMDGGDPLRHSIMETGAPAIDRKSGVWGKVVEVRVDSGGGRHITKT